MKEMLESVLTILKKAAPSEIDKLQALSGLINLQAMLTPDDVEVPADVFSGMDNEQRRLTVMALVAMLVMSLQQ